jgi:hypothetical protein
VIYAALDLTWLTQLAAGARLPDGSSLSILDSQGIILARFPNPEKWAGKPVPDAPVFQLLQRGNQATQELVGVDGVNRLYAFTIRGKAGGRIYVVVGIPKVLFPGQPRLQRNLAGWELPACWLATSWFVGNRTVT